jgi:hypothetical protein
MKLTVGQSFKHIFTLAIFLLPVAVLAERLVTDLLDDAANDWHTPDPAQWYWTHGVLIGSSKIFDGDKTDPAASTFLVSQRTFGGNVSVTHDVSFQKGRYLGVYRDFGRESQSGIWMATGHPLEEAAPANDVERAYIKAVENGYWIVRATGELRIDGDEVVRLRFAGRGDVYNLYRDGHLVATYRKPGGYPAGPLQLRLTNAQATIVRLEVESDWIE